MHSEDSHPKTYVYHSALDDDQIRVLQLQPDDGSGLLRFSFHEKTLSRSAEYDALSYIWGDSKDIRRAVCDGKWISITPNLYAALYQLRKQNRIYPLWVDAVCINQTDLQEKTKQIRKFRDIYKTARKVIIWLGDADESDQPGIVFLQELYEKLGTWDDLKLSNTQYIQLEEIGLPGRTSTVWNSLWHLLRRPWFERVWVIQELMCARQCNILCGQYAIDPNALFGIVSKLNKMHNLGLNLVMAAAKELPIEKYHSVSVSAISLVGMKERLEAGQTFELAELCHLFRMFKATESRDKIFALVGLATDVRAEFIDYDLDLREIYIRVAKTALNSSKDTFCAYLDTLSLVTDISDSLLLSSDVPSWVPSFDRVEFIPFSVMYPTESLDGVVRTELKFGRHDNLLVQGIIVDTLHNVVADPNKLGLAALETHRRDEIFEDLISWDAECFSLVKDFHTYSTGESMFDAYWRTLIVNRSYNGDVPDIHYGHSFMAWRKMLNLSLAWLDMEDGTVRVISTRTAFSCFNFFYAQCYIYYDLYRQPWHTSVTAWILALLLWILLNALFLFFMEIFHQWLTLKRLKTLKRLGTASGRFEQSLGRVMPGRKFCITKNNYIGWVPIHAENGDLICRFRGCRIPFIVRPSTIYSEHWVEETTYRLMGDSYIHGMMDDKQGQMVGTDHTLRTIVLV